MMEVIKAPICIHSLSRDANLRDGGRSDMKFRKFYHRLRRLPHGIDPDCRQLTCVRSYSNISGTLDYRKNMLLGYL